MDEMTIIIGICLVWTGAVCIGYPVGWYLGRRHERQRGVYNECEHSPVVVIAAHRRLAARDILSAEIIEEVKR